MKIMSKIITATVCGLAFLEVAATRFEQGNHFLGVAFLVIGAATARSAWKGAGE